MKLSRQLFAALAAVLVLGGCETVNPSVPPGYAGPTATIRDSALATGSGRADFFYLSSIDGKPIEQSRSKTLQSNAGNGLNMTPRVIGRPVPAQALQLEIVGRTQHAAPIQALTSTEYQVKGVIAFTPEPNKVYVVKGELGNEYSGVWLVEEDTGNIVGKKIEVHGSTALGAFEK